MKTFFSILSILALFVSFSSNAQQSSEDRYRGIMVGSETRVLTSSINKVPYKFLINLPANYHNSSKTYPVCYVLDGQWSFSNVVSTYWDLRYDGMLPEMIIVGLTYDGTNPDYETLRAHDYTPTAIPQLPKSGGGDAYIEVLRKEVIPFIDKEYRTNKVDRSITGTSLGGLFTYYVLFKAPELFNGYIPINPSLWWDNMKCFEYENTFSHNHKSLPVRLSAISGELDAVASFQKLLDQIKSHSYEGLVMESRILEGMGHSGSKSEGHARGLKYVYQRQGIKMTETELKQYTGTYEIRPALQFHVVIKDAELLVTDIPNSPDQKILAVGKNEFCLNGSYYNFQFLRDDKGTVTGMKAELSGNQIVEAKKVK